MSEQPKPFRFLTTEQFTRLTHEEKMNYITRAVELLKSPSRSFPFDESDPAPTKKQED